MSIDEIKKYMFPGIHFSLMDNQGNLLKQGNKIDEKWDSVQYANLICKGPIFIHLYFIDTEVSNERI